MKNGKTNYTLTAIVITILLTLLISIGLSYSYFSANITGGENTTTITVTGGIMNIHYNGGADIFALNIIPSDSPFATKTFTVTGNNTTDLQIHYGLSLIVEENTFTKQAIKFKLHSTNSGNNGRIIPSKITYNNIVSGRNNYSLGTGSFYGPTNGDKIHTYTLELYFPETGVNQNEDQGKILKAHIVIEKVNYVLAKDEDFIKLYSGYNDSDEFYFYKGSDDYVIIPETINGEIVTSTRNMFGEAYDDWNRLEPHPIKGVATKTANITDMEGMFHYNKSASLDLSLFDTSNVTNMRGVFDYSQAISIDLSSFNTSKVTDMSQLFRWTEVINLDLKYLDTTSVTSMYGMFDLSKVLSLDLSNFITSNVTDMSGMFYNTVISVLDLSAFDTSNVTEMDGMFSGSLVTNLNLRSFNTSKVTGMIRMFENIKTQNLDLSSFNTQNVTNMYGMFENSKISVLDLSTFNTSKVSNINNMFKDTTATIGYARTQADADKFNSATNKPQTLTFIVK